MTPTYEQLLADLQKNGLTFSEYDLALARENPAAGYGIMNAKLDYGAATTPEARALANASAERWRAQGGYSGGVDGSQYIPIYKEDTFQYPQYTNSGYQDVYDEKLQNVYDRPSFEYPAMGNGYRDIYDEKIQSVYDRKPFEYQPMDNGYRDAYDAQISKLYDRQPFEYQDMDPMYRNAYDERLQSVYDRKPFSYDPSTDPLYGYYKDAYTREGQRAMEDTLAKVSARTGGLASSYAASAAAQQNNYYMQQLADKIPDLYQMAYQQYANEANRGLQEAQLAGERYGTELNRYNADRNFALGLYNDAYNRDLANAQIAGDRYSTELNRYLADRSFDLGLYNDEYNRAMADAALAGDRYSTELNRYNTDRNFALGLYNDEYNRDLTSASLAAQRYGADLDQYNIDRNFAQGLYADDWTRRQTMINDARDRIDAYLAAGGDINNLPPELVEASGLSDAELNTYALRLALQGGGRYSGSVADEITDPNTQAAVNAISRYLQAGGTIADMPQSLLQASGLSKAEILKMAAGTTTYGTDTGTGGQIRSELTNATYNPETGVYYWNGKAYNNQNDFLTAVNKAGLKSAEMQELLKHLPAGMFGVQ